MKTSELIKMLTTAGWEEVRQKGSHKIFRHPNHPSNISVPEHGKKDLGKGLVKAILREAGL
jgi:predicted RNA binding protein YcfA (HicA-like mRNA interferase family)